MTMLGDKLPEGPIKAATLWTEVQKLKDHAWKEAVDKNDMIEFITKLLHGVEIEGLTAEHIMDSAVVCGEGIMLRAMHNPEVSPLGVVTGAWVDGVLTGMAAILGKAATQGDIVAEIERLKEREG